MKRILAILFVFLFVGLSVFTVKTTETQTVSSTAITSGYAQVLTNDCYILNSANKNNRMFLLEQSYFVKIVEDVDNIFYKCHYLEFDGFVEKSKVSFVEEFPQNPYLTGITFDIYDLSNVCLRNSPETLETDENVLCTMKISSKDLTYYGKCTGEEAVTGLGNIWYYCAYQDEYGNLFKGYVYSPFTRNLSAITNSSESLTLVNITNFAPMDSLLYLNLSTKNLLIIITTLPTLAVIYLFTKQGKKKDSN